MPRAQILVVDDEPSILSTLKKVLSLEGYGVDVAGGVAVAESKLAKQSYDVVMLDIARATASTRWDARDRQRSRTARTSSGTVERTGRSAAATPASDAASQTSGIA